MALVDLELNPKPRQLTWFAALWLPAFGGLVGAILWFRVEAPNAAIAVWGTIAAVSVIGLAVRPVARGAWVVLMVLTFPIGVVVSHLVLGLVYYVVLTPIGLALRLSGRDPMQRAFDEGAESYWSDHPKNADVDRYFKQF